MTITTRKKRAATTILMSAALLAGTIATSPDAHAVGRSACTKSITEWGRMSDIKGQLVHLRTGPGSRYTSRGTLVRGTGIDRLCKRGKWTYIGVTSDAHRGKGGWVASQYVR